MRRPREGGRWPINGAQGLVSSDSPTPIRAPAHLRPRAPRPQRSRTPNTALWVILGVFGALWVVFCGGLVAFLNTETGSKSWETAKRGGQMLIDASNAPGAEEVRALGCETAFVIDLADAALVAEPWVQDDVDPEALRTVEGRMVICQAGTFDDPPTCEAVARAYASGAPDAPLEVMVQVTAGSGSVRSCEGLYDRQGNPLRPLGGAAPSAG